MYTAQEVDARIAQMKAEGRSNSKIIDTVSELCIGWPYVFGAAGEMCTPDNRKKYAGSRPDKKTDIYSACPALSGNGSCDSCKWCGTRMFDCRGFTRWLLAQVDLMLYGGTVTAQWETSSNWVYKGNIEKMPLSLVCCVFREGHTGMHLFGDVTRHCSKCVKEQLLPGVPTWKRFGIPAGLYTDKELESAGVAFDPAKNIPTLRRGGTGELVKQLQEVLNSFGASLNPDGIFGAKTEEAVKTFQKSHGLTCDGIVGPKTRAALGMTAPADQPEALPHRPLNTQGIWDKLMIVVNHNPYAAAGIMGNMFAESSLIANNLQGSGNKALTMTDEEYTAAVDNGTYTAEQFASDGFGYGLCQWTYSTRKAALLQHAKECGLSVGDAQAQIIFLQEELTSSFRSTLEKLLAAKSVREASNAFMLGFEKPKNQGEENQTRRAELGQRYFDQFAEVGKMQAGIEQDTPPSIPVSRTNLLELRACLSDALSIINKVLECDSN